MMVKEPELKLFGRNILLPDKGRTAAGEYSCESSVESSNGGAVDCGVCWYVSGGKNREGGVKADGEEKQGMADGVLNHHLQQEKEVEEEEEGEICEASYQDLNQNPEESHNTPNYPPSEPGAIPKTPLPGHRPPPKALKKPAKILPCPRCKSTDTKFCYFNNYNLNQPRHFCKACQRYWTHGGTTRNVPVGSGRRKNKTYYHVPVTPTNPNGENGPGGPVSMYYYYIAPVGHTGFPGPCPNAQIGVGPGKRSRVDDPQQAVKSSIWSTLGIECADFRKEGLLKGLQLRGDEKKSNVVVDSSLLQANPAALARSISFWERV